MKHDSPSFPETKVFNGSEHKKIIEGTLNENLSKIQYKIDKNVNLNHGNPY